MLTICSDGLENSKSLAFRAPNRYEFSKNENLTLFAYWTCLQLERYVRMKAAYYDEPDLFTVIFSQNGTTRVVACLI